MKPLVINGFNRDPSKIKSLFKYVGDNQITLTEECNVYFPFRYINTGLAEISDLVTTLGIFAIVDNNGNYSVCNIPARIQMEPFIINDVDINGVEYKELVFKKNSLFIYNTNLVKKALLMNDIFEEFFINGHIPWYMNYDDVGKIFDLAKKYAGSPVGDSPSTVELITSVIARTKGNKLKYYRTSIENNDDVLKNPPEFTGLLNVFYAFSNTTNKLVGNYFTRGITASLVNKTDELEKIDKILRS